jgi:hypothetical protein
MLHLNACVTRPVNLLEIQMATLLHNDAAGRPLKPAARDMAGVQWLDVYRQRKDTL